MIYLLLVDGFEEIEALTPVDVLRRCGAEVVTVGVDGKIAVGAHNIPVECDILFEEIKKENMEMLVLPGGPGHTALKTEKVRELIRYADNKDIYIASICAAPSVVGEMGLLEGREATCFPGFEQELKGADVLDMKVVTDGNYITAKGAGAAGEFAFKLAELVCGLETAEKIKNAMQY